MLDRLVHSMRDTLVPDLPKHDKFVSEYWYSGGYELLRMIDWIVTGMLEKRHGYPARMSDAEWGEILQSIHTRIVRFDELESGDMPDDLEGQAFREWYEKAETEKWAVAREAIAIFSDHIEDMWD